MSSTHTIPGLSLAEGRPTALSGGSIPAQCARLKVSAQPKRVHVVGGPGSGKTTLSQQLAARLGVPAFELDTLAAAGPAPEFRILRSLQERLEELDRVAALPGWITEGSFLWWTEELFETADVVIWLDVPVRHALWNIFVRHWRDYISEVMGQPTLRLKLRTLRYPHIRHLVSFLPYAWKYYHNPPNQKPAQVEALNNGRAFTRAATMLVVEGYRQKVIHCTRFEDIPNLLQCLDSGIGSLEGSNTMDADTQLPRTRSGERVSAYAEMHKADWIPINYDQNIYDPAGYDTFVWELYKPYLIRIVQGLAAQHEHMTYLDFACGTGRIISTLEGIPAVSVGLDISPQMVEYARTKVSRSDLRCGDILADAAIIDSDFGLITAFRFFLNTEPEMRALVMNSLAKHLAGEDSRLIFNIHLNRWSVDGLKSLYTRLRGWGPRTTMTYPMVRRLVEDAGLEIESWYGFALWPNRLYRGRFGPLLKGIDRQAARIRPLRWISKDMLFVCRPRKGAMHQG
jgi:SAM-dependent methyltransferase